jgi:homoserine dehydrogenase
VTVPATSVVAPHRRAAQRVGAHAHVPSAATVRVALAGCGAVGGALVHLMRESRAGLSGMGPRLDLARVFVRDAARARPAALNGTPVTDDLDEFLATPADVVVEATGEVAVARRLAWEVLSRGGRFVTANRALIVDRGPELAELAVRSGGVLDFGAAAGACLPVVRLLWDRAAGFGIRALRGVFNGAANDLLGRLTTGISYEAALAEARPSSAAARHADPHDDVSGRNGAEQIAMLAWLAFGCHPRTLRVRRRGLGADATDWSSIAAAMGGVVKFVAEAVETPEGVVASVEPTLVAASGALASAEDGRAVIEIESRLAGTIVGQGRGVDGVVMANMLFADLLRDAIPASHLMPLPSPSMARTTPADQRELRWLMLLPREGMTALDDACCAGGIAWEEVFSTTRPRARSIVAFCCTPAAVETLVGGLEGTGLRPKWIRATA